MTKFYKNSNGIKGGGNYSLSVDLSTKKPLNEMVNFKKITLNKDDNIHK